MALPKDSIKAIDTVRASNRKVAQAVARLAHVTEKAFQRFWGGSVDSVIEQAAATNQFASEAGQTALEIFVEHGKAVDYCLACDESLAFSTPPVDMRAVFDDAGMLDLVALRAALELLPES